MQPDKTSLYKKAILITLAAIILIVVVVITTENAFYAITSNRDDVIVSAVDQGKQTTPSKLFGLYLIPRSSSTLIVTHSAGSTPVEKIVRPLYTRDLSIGYHTLQAELSPQSDLSVNGPAVAGCSFGKYPKTFNYSCSGSAGITAYDATNPLDFGTEISLPPTTITAISNQAIRDSTPERLLALDRYSNGLLTILLTFDDQADTNEAFDSYSLRYIDENGVASNYPIHTTMEQDEGGRYQLLTDSSGSQRFGIIDTKKYSLALFTSLEDTSPVTINLAKAYDNTSLSLTCSLNTIHLACYNGLYSSYNDSDEEDEAKKQARDGKIELFNLETGGSPKSYIVSKDTPVAQLCVDQSATLYSYDETTLSTIDTSKHTIKKIPLSTSTTAISCGKNIHYVSDQSVYVLRDTVAHLAFQSDTFNLNSIHAYGDDVTMFGSYTGRPQEQLSLTSNVRDTPYMTPRVIDIVSKVVEDNKTLFFDTRFTPSSVTYVLLDGSDESKKAIETLKQSSTKHGLQFAPEFRDLTDLRQIGVR